MSRPPQTHFHRTAAYVRLHARRRPLRVAVVRNDVPITYARFDHDLAAMTRTLAGLGLRPGDVAAISHHDLYVQLLLVFGFESLGVATGSFRMDEGLECHALLEAADLVMAVSPIARPICRRLFTITETWVEETLAASAPAVTPVSKAAADEVAIIVRSSGTTGQPKRMGVTQGMLAARLRKQRHTLAGGGRAADERFLAFMHFSAGSTHRYACLCFRLGTTFVFDNTQPVAAILSAVRPTQMRMLPYQLRFLLAKLPEGGSGPLLPELTMQVAGAKLPDDLRRLTLQKLAGRIIDYYGCNEAGGIGTVEESGELTPIAGMEVEIVDHRGLGMPQGEIGFLRIRGPGLVERYIDDPQTTARMFRDGWFYPGDVGMLIGPSRFRLVGRRPDVLNLGGIKRSSAELESRILAEARPRDVAVLQRDDAGASSPLTVCVVVDPGADLRHLVRTIRPIIDFPFSVRVVREIPRTLEGKIKRIALRQALFRNAASRGAAAADAPRQGGSPGDSARPA